MNDRTFALIEDPQGLLAAIVASTDDAIISKTLDGTITSWNAAAERTFGWLAEEAIGQSIKLIVPPERFQEEDVILERLRNGERIEHFETVRITRDGRRLDYSVTISPLRDRAGRVIGASKVGRDITAVKKAKRESEKVLALATRAGGMGAWRLDVRTRKVWWSAEMEAIFGLPPGGFEALGGDERAFFGLVHPEDHGQVAAAIAETMKTGNDYRIDFRFRPASGEWCWMEARGQAFFGARDELETVYGVGIDVTDRKRDEERLRRQTTELAEADRRKDEFLAMLAHELRNPLAPIRNALQYLQLKGSPAPELQSARDIIERQVRQLVRLVDDLLDVSRISRGKISLQKQRANLNMVVESAIESSRPLIDASEHRLVVRLPDEPVEIEVDVTRLAQVLQNLLNNAAKYTPRGGVIELAAAVEGDAVVIRVKDNGIGIPPEMLGSIFEMFMQGDRRLERASGGLGIGLTLVQRLVELHGGRVAALSEGPGRGSEFVVRLPLRVVSAHGRTVVATEGPDAARPVRVLVVDDNRDGADSLAMTLRALGHEVRVEYDGRRGAEAALGWRPDLALLDIGLPGLNGYELARSLRQHASTRETLLVAVTGWGQQEDRRRSAQAGFDHHLVKPVDPLHLRVLLHAAAERAAPADTPLPS